VVVGVPLDPGGRRPRPGRAGGEGRLQPRDPVLHRRQPGGELPREAQHEALGICRPRRQLRVRRPVRRRPRSAEVGQRARRVGVAPQQPQPQAQPAALARGKASPGGGLHGGQRRLEAADCRHPGVGVLRPLPRPDQPRRRARVARPLEMMGNGVGIGVRPGDERVGGPAVPRAPPDRRRPFVDRLADEGMGEAHPRAVGGLRQQPRGGRLLDVVQQGVLGQVADRRPEGQRHFLPDNRGEREELPRLRTQQAEPPRDQLPQQRRHGHGGQVREYPASRPLLQHPLPFEGPQQLAQEEGVPFRALVEIAHQPPPVRSAQGVARRDERPDSGRIERAQSEPGGARLAHEERYQRAERVAAPDLVGAVGGEGEERRVRQPARQDAQQIERGGVGPVEIIQQQDERLAGGECRQVVAHAPDNRLLAAQGLAAPRRGQHRRRQRGEVGVARGSGQRLGPGAVGRGLAQVVATADQHQRTLFARRGQQRLRQRRLADPRLAADEHQRPTPGEGPRERVA